MFPKQAVEASCRTSRPFVLRQLGSALCAQVSGLARSKSTAINSGWGSVGKGPDCGQLFFHDKLSLSGRYPSHEH
jgi:hypothetical protein